MHISQDLNYVTRCTTTSAHACTHMHTHTQTHTQSCDSTSIRYVIYAFICMFALIIVGQWFCIFNVLYNHMQM